MMWFLRGSRAAVWMRAVLVAGCLVTAGCAWKGPLLGNDLRNDLLQLNEGLRDGGGLTTRSAEIDRSLSRQLNRPGF